MNKTLISLGSRSDNHQSPKASSVHNLSRLGSVGLRLILTLVLWSNLPAHARVIAVSVRAPALSSGTTTNVTSPVHFQATAESDSKITGYVVYIDNQNVYRNFSPALNAWVLLAPGTTHSLYIKAWDSTGSLLRTATYSIRVTRVAPPTPPATATRTVNIDGFSWTVDNQPDVGGQCHDGSIGTFTSSSDPNTSNAPNPGAGQHFLVRSRCTYDDSLFYWKSSANPQPNHTNFLWEFWFYIPTTTSSSAVQALEFDLFQALKLSGSVREFMFGSQCNYPANQWQLWLPQNGGLGWVNTGLSPCKLSTGVWHHAIYFLQRVTTSGYQQIPSSFSSSTDGNVAMRFGTLTIDGKTHYLGRLSVSILQPTWSPVLGVQHQLDSAASGVTIEEYVNAASLTAW